MTNAFNDLRYILPTPASTIWTKCACSVLWTKWQHCKTRLKCLEGTNSRLTWLAEIWTHRLALIRPCTQHSNPAKVLGTLTRLNVYAQSINLSGVPIMQNPAYSRAQTQDPVRALQTLRHTWVLRISHLCFALLCWLSAVSVVKLLNGQRDQMRQQRSKICFPSGENFYVWAASECCSKPLASILFQLRLWADQLEETLSQMTSGAMLHAPEKQTHTPESTIL